MENANLKKIAEIKSEFNNSNSKVSSENENISIFENYEENYENSEWEEIEPQKGLFSSSYTYKLSDGTTIKLDDIENVIVKVNKNTGEIILAGAENAIIKGNDSGIKINIFDSTLDKITTGDGNDSINLYNTEVLNDISTKNGDDTIKTYDNSSINNIFMGDGNDYITIDNTKVAGEIDSGAGNDEITISKESQIKEILAGSGTDKININDSQITGNIDGGNDDDIINIVNSFISNNIDGGKGNDKITLDNSEVQGTIQGGSYFDLFGTVKDDDEIDIINNSKVNNIKGNNGNDTINILDSSVKGNIEGDDGNDNIFTVNASLNKISGGKDQDKFTFRNTKIGETLITGTNVKDLVNTDIEDIDISGTATATATENINTQKTNTKEKNELDEDTEIKDIPGIVNIAGMSESTLEASQDVIDDIASKYTNKILTEEEQYYALIIDTFAQNLEDIKAQFSEQENEDGVIRDAYNWVKQLTGLGVSKEDIEAAISEQEQMIKEMISALNNEGNKTFEEVYEKWTGNKYNEENIIEYIESAQLYSLAINGLAKTSAFQSQISSVDSLGEVLELFESYYGKEQGREKLNELLQKSIAEHPSLFGWAKSIEIDENNKLIVSRPDKYSALGPVPGTSYTETIEDIDDVTNMIRTIPKGFDLSVIEKEFSEKFENQMGFSIEQLQEKHIADQEKALGKNTSFQKLIDKYCADQEGFADKLSKLTQIGGIALIAGGGLLTLVCPPAGVTLMTAGKWTAIAGTFSDNAIDLIDDLASENGLSEEEAWNLIKESITEVALLYSGSKINGIATNAKDIVLSATQNKALSFLAEIGTDASLSLLTDLMITGEIDLSGEGLSQLLGIISGIAGAKVNTYTKEAFDNADTLFKEGKIDEAYDFLISKGISQKQIFNKYSQSEIDRIANNYKETNNFDNVLKELQSSKILSYKNSPSLENEILSKCIEFEYDNAYKMFENGANWNEIEAYLKTKDIISKNDIECIKNNVETKSLINTLENDFNINLSKYKQLDFNSQQGKMIAKDIELLYKAKKQGINVNDLMVPSAKNISDGLAKTEIGDVFEIEGSDNIFIKTADGNYKEINISKDAYCRLFPIIDRYASGQQHSGDCYLVSSLNSIMSEPKTREILLSCFTENPDGSITVKMPNDKTEIVIKPGQTINDIGVTKNKHMTGALGMQLLEYLYKVDYAEKTAKGATQQIETYINTVTNIYNNNKEFFEQEGITDPTELGNYFENKSDSVKYELMSKYNISITDERMKMFWMYIGVNKKFMINDDGTLNNQGIAYLKDALGIEDINTLNEIFSTYSDKYSNISSFLSEKDFYADLMTKYNEGLKQIKDPFYYFEIVEKAAGNGGYSNDVFEAFGLDNPKSIRKEEMSEIIDKIINNPDLAENYIITAGTIPTKKDLMNIYNDPNSYNYQYYHDNPDVFKKKLEEAPESIPFGLVSRHAYSFEITKNDAGETVINVTNPWAIDYSGASKKVITLTVEEFKQYFNNIYIAEIPKK